MDLDRYLERISFHGDLKPTLDTLGALVRAHVCSVPFENIDVQLGNPLTIEPAAAYEKIVERRRGGWCYEHNGLFGWALSEIGFDVTRVAAAVMRHERGEIADANHLCLLVEIDAADELYLADVGFGGSLLEPLALKPGYHVQLPFHVGLRKLKDGWRFLEDIGKGEFSFDFKAEPADESALESKCDYLQTDPSSGFVMNLVVQQRLPEAHKTLRGRVFSVATNNGIETGFLETADALAAHLRDHFDLGGVDAHKLWPRVAARHEELTAGKSLTDTYEIRSRSHNKPLRD